MQSINLYIKTVTFILTLWCVGNTVAQTPPFQESDIPLIVIEREGAGIPQFEKLNASMRVIDNATGLNDFDGPFAYDDRIGIETRGASSLIYPKQSFSVETRDEEGNNLNTKLLGFPLENDWIFDGPYDDKTFMRNHLAYDLTREMGWYAPRARFFNLVMDTVQFDYYTYEFTKTYEYKGVYVLLERIKRDDDRVDISLLRPDEIDLPGTPNGFPDVTGGYIIKVDESSGSAFEGWFSSNGNLTWNYVYTYPKSDDIAPQQTTYIQNFMSNFEMVMDGNDYANPVNGYPTIINEDSFIDFIIIQELSKNIDGYRKSSYFHKTKNSRDSLLYAGPIWDFNLAFGNAVNFDGNSTTGFQYLFNQNHPNSQFPVPFYWEKLMSNTGFLAKVACRYNQHRGMALSNHNILGKIDSMATILQTAQQLNYEQYDILNTIVSNEAPATFNTYQEAVDDLKNWITERLSFLDSQWAGESFDVKSTSGNSSVCPNTPVTLSVEGSLTGLYDWQPTTYITGSTTGASVEVVADSTITYIVSGLNSFGCVDTAQLKITIDGFATTTGGPNKRQCPGEVDTLEASGAISYLWEPAAGLSDPTIANPIANPDTTTTYKVTMISQEQCEVFDFVRVTVKDIPPLAVSEDLSICENANVSLMATSDEFSTYLWTANPPDPTLNNTNNVVPNPTVQPTENTIYTVEVTGENNCTNTEDVEVEVVATGTLNFGMDTSICVGESVQLVCPTVNNLLSVNWAPVNGLDDPTNLCPVVSPNETTTYNISAQTTDGCNYSGSLTITIIQDINICKNDTMSTGGACENFSTTISESSTICKGESTTLQASGGSVYRWTPAIGLSASNIANPRANPENTTTYTVEITDDNGDCSSFETLTITVNNLPSAFAGPDITLCSGDEVLLQGAGGQNYSWSPVEGLSNPLIANPVVNTTTNQTYTVLVSDDNGCTASDEVNVIVQSKPIAFAGMDTTVCESAIINLSGSGAGDNGSYLWSPADIVSNANAQNIQVNVAETTTLSLTVTDENDCVSMDQVTITVAPEPNVQTSGDLSICEGGSANLFAEGGEIYQWEPTDFLDNPNSPNPICTPVGITDIEYTVTVANTFGCSDTKKVVVSIDDEIEADAGNDEIICRGESVQLNAAGGIAYTWSPIVNNEGVSIIDDATLSNPRVSPTETTTFTLMVSDGSCSGSDAVTINVIDELSIIVNGNTALSAGESTILEAEGAENFVWSPNDGTLSCINCANPEATPLSTTTYTVTGSQGNCTGTTTITVNVNACELNTTISEAVSLCNEASAQLEASGGTSYQWSPDDGSLSCLTCPNPIASPNSNTTYSVLIANENCETTESVVVTVGESSSIFTNPIENLCMGDALSYDLSSLLSYSIIPQIGLEVENDMATFIPNESTVYTLEGILENGCAVNDMLQLNILETQAIESKAYDICNGSSIILNEDNQLSGAVSWNPVLGLDDPTSANPTANPLETTTYFLSYTNENNCISEATFTINVAPASFASVDDDVVICAGGQAQLQAYGGVSYSWSPSSNLANPNSFNPIASPINTRTYTVAVIDENGCVDEKEVTVFVEDQLNISVSDSVRICTDGQGVRLDAHGAFVYEWTPAEGLSDQNIAKPIANPTNTTVYTLTATDGACTDTKEVYVEVINESLTVDAGADKTICEGGAVRLQATSQQADAYRWEPRTGLSDRLSSSPIASPKQTTTYSVEAIIVDRNYHNSILCTNFDEITVFVEPPLADIAIPESQTICAGTSVELTVESIPGLLYSWTPTNSLSEATIANPIASPTESTTYQLAVSTVGGCVNTYEVEVNVNTLDNATAGENLLTCRGDSIQLQAGGAVTYVWDEHSSLSDHNSRNPYVLPNETTTYYVNLIVGACTKRDSVTVEVVDFENITEVINLCQNGTITLQASGGDSYFWTSDLPIADPTSAAQLVQPVSSTLYNVEISTANCTFTKTFDVQIAEAAEVTLPSSYQSCVDSKIELVLNGDNLSNIEWMPEDGLSNANIANPILTISEEAMYTVSFTVDNTCVNQLSTQISIIDSIRVSLNSSFFAICEGETQALEASGGFNYSWSPPTGLSATTGASIRATPSETTIYTVEASDENNACSGSEQVTIIVNSFPEDAGAIDDFEACEGDNIQLQASGGSNYQWLPDDLLDNPTSAEPTIAEPANIISSQTFTVRISENECVFEDSVTVTIKACLVDFVPSAFSPNNDGINDVWVIEGIHRFPENELNVYNRWGQLLFSSRNYQNNWHGDFKGAALPEATYYYTLEIEGEEELRKGTVSIIR